MANVSPFSTPVTMSKKYVSLSGEWTFTFVFYGCDSFFEETIGQKYLVHFPSVYGVKWRSLQRVVAPQGFLQEHLPVFDGLSKFVMLWIDFSKSHFGPSKEFSQFQVQCGWVAEHCRSWLLWKKELYLVSSWLFLKESEDTSWLFQSYSSWGKGGYSHLSICLSCSSCICHCSILGAICHQISLFSILLGVFH